MKIISNNECYVQGKDIEYITNYVPKIGEEIKQQLGTILYKPNEFIKIEDEKLREFIEKTPFIISFNKLYGLPYTVLEQMLLQLKIDLYDIEYSQTTYLDDSDRIEYQEKKRYKKKNKQYLIEQILEMIEYKKGKTQIDYPDIPNPCLSGIQSEEFLANPSIKYGNILIYKKDGSTIDIEENPQFYDIAYKLYMHDTYGENIDDVELEHTLSENKKYVSVKSKELLKEENMKLERKQ